jgi:hypothetical protein
MLKWNGKTKVGCSEGRWISSLVRRPDRMYCHVHESYNSFGSLQRVSEFGKTGMDCS